VENRKAENSFGMHVRLRDASTSMSIDAMRDSIGETKSAAPRDASLNLESCRDCRAITDDEWVSGLIAFVASLKPVLALEKSNLDPMRQRLSQG
jgi:hypothetical protein